MNQLKLSDYFLKRININTVNLIFTLSAIIVVASHVLFSLGLYDGSDDLLQMIEKNRFFFLELSRRFFDILCLLPSYLVIKFSSLSHLSFLIQMFSFGFIWIHIFSLLGCYLILPENKKNLIFFPLFAFFTGPVVSLTVSISVALSVCSYVWLTAYIIHYSNLSNKIHKILLVIIPLPLILSHELMSYMAWPLIVLCWYKNNTEKDLFNKFLIGFVRIFLVIVSVVQTIMIIFHEELQALPHSNDLNRIASNIIRFDFLFSPEFNFLIVLSMLIFAYFFIQLYKDSIKYKISKAVEILTVLSLIFILIASVLQIQSGFIADYSIRFYPPVIALPCGLLLWWIHTIRRKANWMQSKGFLLSCILFCVTLVFFRLNFDYTFHKYQIKISEQLAKCKGMLQWEKFANNFKDTKFNTEILRWHDWQIFQISVLYPKSKVVESVVMPSFWKCEGQCLKNRVYLLMKLHNTKFFDMSKLQSNISNNISVCKKKRAQKSR